MQAQIYLSDHASMLGVAVPVSCMSSENSKPRPSETCSTLDQFFFFAFSALSSATALTVVFPSLLEYMLRFVVVDA